MAIDLVEIVYTLLTPFLVGGFILALPAVGRLGRVLQEWIELRRESQPQLNELAETASRVRNVEQQIVSLNQHVALLADRLEFTETLIESGQRPLIGRREDASGVD
jgi:hypothetical protein